MSRIHPVSVPMAEGPINGVFWLLFLVSFGCLPPSFGVYVVTHSVSVTAGPVNVTVNASAVPPLTPCGSGAMTVPTRGRVDVVTRSLLVLVSVKQPSGV